MPVGQFPTNFHHNNQHNNHHNNQQHVETPGIQYKNLANNNIANNNPYNRFNSSKQQHQQQLLQMQQSSPIRHLHDSHLNQNQLYNPLNITNNLAVQNYVPQVHSQTQHGKMYHLLQQQLQPEDRNFLPGSHPALLNSSLQHPLVSVAVSSQNIATPVPFASVTNGKIGGNNAVSSTDNNNNDPNTNGVGLLSADNNPTNKSDKHDDEDNETQLNNSNDNWSEVVDAIEDGDDNSTIYSNRYLAHDDDDTIPQLCNPLVEPPCRIGRPKKITLHVNDDTGQFNSTFESGVTIDQYNKVKDYIINNNEAKLTKCMKELNIPQTEVKKIFTNLAEEGFLVKEKSKYPNGTFKIVNSSNNNNNINNIFFKNSSESDQYNKVKEYIIKNNEAKLTKCMKELKITQVDVRIIFSKLVEEGFLVKENRFKGNYSIKVNNIQVANNNDNEVDNDVEIITSSVKSNTMKVVQESSDSSESEDEIDIDQYNEVKEYIIKSNEAKFTKCRNELKMTQVDVKIIFSKLVEEGFLVKENRSNGGYTIYAYNNLVANNNNTDVEIVTSSMKSNTMKVVQESSYSSESEDKIDIDQYNEVKEYIIKNNEAKFAKCMKELKMTQVDVNIIFSKLVEEGFLVKENRSNGGFTINSNNNQVANNNDNDVEIVTLSVKSITMKVVQESSDSSKSEDEIDIDQYNEVKEYIIKNNEAKFAKCMKELKMTQVDVKIIFSKLVEEGFLVKENRSNGGFTINASNNQVANNNQVTNSNDNDVEIVVSSVKSNTMKVVRESSDSSESEDEIDIDKYNEVKEYIIMSNEAKFTKCMKELKMTQVDVKIIFSKLVEEGFLLKENRSNGGFTINASNNQVANNNDNEVDNDEEIVTSSVKSNTMKVVQESSDTSESEDEIDIDQYNEVKEYIIKNNEAKFAKCMKELKMSQVDIKIIFSKLVEEGFLLKENRFKGIYSINANIESVNDGGPEEETISINETKSDILSVISKRKVDHIIPSTPSMNNTVTPNKKLKNNEDISKSPKVNLSPKNNNSISPPNKINKIIITPNKTSSLFPEQKSRKSPCKIRNTHIIPANTMTTEENGIIFKIQREFGNTSNSINNDNNSVDRFPAPTPNEDEDNVVGGWCDEKEAIDEKLLECGNKHREIILLSNERNQISHNSSNSIIESDIDNSNRSSSSSCCKKERDNVQTQSSKKQKNK
jgi:DNA-binding MarR family transcriptional regulator